MTISEEAIESTPVSGSWAHRARAGVCLGALPSFVQGLPEWSKARRLDTGSVVLCSTNSNKPIIVDKMFVRAVQRAKIEDFHFHDCRHTAASYLAMSGATLAEIAELLGHKTLSMVK